MILAALALPFAVVAIVLLIQRLRVPAFLAVMGRRVNRLRVIPRRVLERRAAQDVTGGWHSFAMASSSALIAR